MSVDAGVLISELVQQCEQSVHCAWIDFRKVLLIEYTSCARDSPLPICAEVRKENLGRLILLLRQSTNQPVENPGKSSKMM